MLEPRHYIQGEAFVAEKHHLFAQSWLPVGAEAQLASPGDFLSGTVGGWPILAVRGEDGVVRGLMNSCRHKNMPVVDAGHGNCTHFRCRFHGWTYTLDGRFRDAPLPVAPINPAGGPYNLAPLRVQTLLGTVCVNLDASTPGPGHAAAAGDGMGQYFGTVATDIGCNWKTLLEHTLTTAPLADWHEPLLLMHAQGDAQMVQQIMPRSFLRTRVLSHVYGAPGANREHAVAQAAASSAALQNAAEALQAQRANTVTLDRHDARVTALHQSVLAAYGAAQA